MSPCLAPRSAVGADGTFGRYRRVDGVALAYDAKVLRILTTLAVACYAANGALKAIRHEMDFVGALAIAMVTAVGGGTARDLLLGRPVFWIHDPLFLYVSGVTAVAAVAATAFARPGPQLLLVTDTIGLALFAVIGAHAANAAGAPLVSTVLTGGLTGFGGGIARDLLCGEVPRVLKRDIHATAAISGATVYVLIQRGGGSVASGLGAGIFTVVLLRTIETRWGIHFRFLRMPSRDA